MCVWSNLVVQIQIYMFALGGVFARVRFCVNMSLKNVFGCGVTTRCGLSQSVIYLLVVALVVVAPPGHADQPRVTLRYGWLGRVIRYRGIVHMAVPSKETCNSAGCFGGAARRLTNPP